MLYFLWYNIFLSRILNWFIAPIAYLLRNNIKKNGFLWWFLSDNNMYGDKNWKPGIKSKFIRAILWSYRNPLQNYYWKDYVEGTESSYSGYAKVKYGSDVLSWRTAICSDTGDWHGKIIDFKGERLGRQDIKFKRTDMHGNVQHCYRKSTCVPYRFLWFIICSKRRSGHEHGLMQYNFSFPRFSYKKNKDGWIMWKNSKWKTIQV